MGPKLLLLLAAVTLLAVGANGEPMIAWGGCLKGWGGSGSRAAAHPWLVCEQSFLHPGAPSRHDTPHWARRFQTGPP